MLTMPPEILERLSIPGLPMRTAGGYPFVSDFLQSSFSAALPPAQSFTGADLLPLHPLLAQIVDSYGNPISNVDLRFTNPAAESKEPAVPLPSNYRGVEFYLEPTCANPYPLYGECATAQELTLKTAYYGAPVEAILGNTVNTRYTVRVSAPSYPLVATLTLTLNTTGYRALDDYLAPGLYIRYLDIVNAAGEQVNAAPAGKVLPAPLTAELFLLQDEYEMVEAPCTPQYLGGLAGCWAIKSTGLVKAQPVADGMVTFTSTAGSGAVVATANLQNGKYSATYRTGAAPAVNTIEAVGDASVSVPQAAYNPKTNKTFTQGYQSSTLPLRTVTLKSGQEALFDPETEEPVVAANWQKALYTVYGVRVTLRSAPEVLRLSSDGRSPHAVIFNYVIEPAAYQAASVNVDLLQRPKSQTTGNPAFRATLVGPSGQGFGQAILAAGSPFALDQSHFAQLVLNRGTAVEIKGETVPLKTLLCGLDIDTPECAEVTIGVSDVSTPCESLTTNKCTNSFVAKNKDGSNPRKEDIITVSGEAYWGDTDISSQITWTCEGGAESGSCLLLPDTTATGANYKFIPNPVGDADGRSVPLSYKITASVTVNDKTYTDSWPIEQDKLDQLRQEYHDMNKAKQPERDEFANSTSYKDPGNFTYNDASSNEDITIWSIFEIAQNLQNVRAEVGNRPMPVNSAYRTPIYNAGLKPTPGKPESLHIYGHAADISANQDYNGDGGTPNRADWDTLSDAAKVKGACIEPYAYASSWVHMDWGRTICPWP